MADKASCSQQKIKICHIIKPSRKYKIKSSNKTIVYLLDMLLSRVYNFFTNDDLVNIILNRHIWIGANPQSDQNLTIRNLSIKFSSLLNYKAKMCFNETVVNKLGEISSNNKIKYAEKYDKFAKDFDEKWKFYAESNNPPKKYKNLFEVVELASKYYDRNDEVFPYVVKIFYHELFVLNPRIRISNNFFNANTLFLKEDLTFDEEIYLDCVYKHAHFRQLRHDDLYQKFFEVYFKICKSSEIAFHHLNPIEGVEALKKWVLNYLQFFNEDIFSLKITFRKKGQ